MRFAVGDLVWMDRGTAKNHMVNGGFPDHILKVGLVISIREREGPSEPAGRQITEYITVKFPQGEPEEWLANNFEWVGSETWKPSKLGI